MPHPRIDSQQISQRGKQLYEQGIRAKVEREENIGKIVSIDVETGEYEVGNDVLCSSEALLAKHPDAALYGIRIGYNAVYALG
jgi:carotenoid cleavage dioxygenase-like enzyme